MKNSIILVFLLIVGCTQDDLGEDQYNVVTNIVDVTDPRLIKPDSQAKSLISLYDFKTKPNQAAEFNLVIVNDKLINDASIVRLANSFESQARTNGKKALPRKETVVHFFRNIRNEYNKLYRSGMLDTSYEKSEVWVTLCNELNKNKYKKATKHYVVIHSDFGENTDLFNAYFVSNANNTPNEIAKKLKSISNISTDLSNTYVIVVYNTTNVEDDKQFRLMTDAVRLILDDSHCKFTTVPNNNFTLKDLDY